MAGVVTLFSLRHPDLSAYIFPARLLYVSPVSEFSADSKSRVPDASRNFGADEPSFAGLP